MPLSELVFRDKVKKEDAAALKKVVTSTGFFSAEETAIALELLEERLGRGNASGYHFLLAELGGEILGYTCYGPIPGTAGSFDIYWIVVDQERRRSGIGAKLLARTEEAVAAGGGKRIYVQTSSRELYEPTRDFYRRHGYAEEARLKDYYGAGDSLVIFSKTLPETKPA